MLLTREEMTFDFGGAKLDPVRDRDLLDRLLAELDADETPTAEADARRPLLDAVVKETLRRHPIVSDVLRTVVRPFRLGTYDVPIGWAVGVQTG